MTNTPSGVDIGWAPTLEVSQISKRRCAIQTRRSEEYHTPWPSGPRCLRESLIFSICEDRSIEAGEIMPTMPHKKFPELIWKLVVFVCQLFAIRRYLDSTHFLRLWDTRIFANFVPVLDQFTFGIDQNTRFVFKNPREFLNQLTWNKLNLSKTKNSRVVILPGKTPRTKNENPINKQLKTSWTRGCLGKITLRALAPMHAVY
jgi:hypothetical protein